ncbi:MAG: L,D-transpeptidase [Mycobacteriaceae bacterium]|nr:L,D-transpeptidase [Mycobacteriaceae bacterium]
MRSPLGIRAATALAALTIVAATIGAKAPVLADSESEVPPGTTPAPAEVIDQAAAPSDPAPAADPAAPSPATPPEETPPGQNTEPVDGTTPFSAPTINPSNGATVGVAKPIIINFAAPVTDRPMAEAAIHIESNPPVPGKFYWMSDRQVRWRPLDFWPDHTTVNIDAAGTKSSFSTGDALIATADNATHQMTITRNGNVEQVFPISMGKPGHDTPNGTYYVQDKFADIDMDSATYGVSEGSPDGYNVHVKLAVQFDNSGNFVHSAPWSVADQGQRNVSHGCINISPSNARWFYNNFGIGDPIVVMNSVGSYPRNDGSQDWQI